MSDFDSTADTNEHIGKVQQRIREVQSRLDHRAAYHDASKLEEPEKTAYDNLMRFKSSHDIVYGSPEYTEGLKILGPALDHHYANNSHHPQHWPQEETDEMRRLKLHIARYEDIAPRSDKLKQARKELAILETGVNGMSILDILEMLCDWKAAGERYKVGNIAESLAHNRERFGLSDQLYAILENTVKELGW